MVMGMRYKYNWIYNITRYTISLSYRYHIAIIIIISKMEAITRTEVIQKFTEIHKKYTLDYGYMVTTLPDDFSVSFIENNPNLQWTQTYNHYASKYVPVSSATIYVSIFGQKLPIQLERPIEEDHHNEFEDYFRFGGHNDGFTTNRIIASFPTLFNADIDIVDILSSSGDDKIDETYAMNALLLLVCCGYVKYWKAFYEFNSWFETKNIVIGIGNGKSSDIVNQYIMEHYSTETSTTTETETTTA